MASPSSAFVRSMQSVLSHRRSSTIASYFYGTFSFFFLRLTSGLVCKRPSGSLIKERSSTTVLSDFSIRKLGVLISSLSMGRVGISITLLFLSLALCRPMLLVPTGVSSALLIDSLLWMRLSSSSKKSSSCRSVLGGSIIRVLFLSEIL